MSLTREDVERIAAETYRKSVAAETHRKSMAADLPGEPVEPEDLRVGDRVAFTYKGRQYRRNLVKHRHFGLCADERNLVLVIVNKYGEFDDRVSNVRLLKRAPREGELDAAAWRRKLEKERARAKKAEAERDGWKANHDALRADVEVMPCISFRDDRARDRILARDDERIAKERD